MSVADVVLRVRGLNVTFDGHTILEDISFAMHRGEIVGVIGPGGVGKSVLVKACCGLMRPDSGYIEVLGQDISTIRDRELQRLRERLGLCFQNYALFDFMTVAQNIGFPMQQTHQYTPDEIEVRVRERLAGVDLARAYDQFPSELSGGMKKRVGLARATINDPELCFFDDPTAGLDPVTSSKIFDLVRASQQRYGATCLVVSHDIDRMKACCDRYLLFENGRIHWRGTLNDAMASTDPVVDEFFAVKHAGLLGHVGGIGGVGGVGGIGGVGA